MATTSWTLSRPTEGWNSLELARTYFHHSELQRQWAFSALGRSPLQGDERLLDFGCGDGKVSAMLSRLLRAGRVTAVDTSPFMLRYGQSLFPPEDYPNLKFQESEGMRFDNWLCFSQMDVITSFCVFHLVADPETVLSRFREVLTPQGRLILSVPSAPPAALLDAIVAELSARGRELSGASPSCAAARDEDGLRQLLEEAGFAVSFCKDIGESQPFLDRESLVQWCVGTLSANFRIQWKESQDFFNAVMDRYVSSCPGAASSDGRHYMPWRRVEAVAELG